MTQTLAKDDHLDPRLITLIETLRGRIRRYVVWESVWAIAAVVLTAFWVGLALDYLPVKLGGTEMPRSARLILLAVVAVVVAVVTYRLLISRLTRPLPADSLALLLERQHPTLGGRLVTSVQLTQLGRHGDAHDPALLRRVHDQAAIAAKEVDTDGVLLRRPLLQKAAAAIPLFIAVVLLVIISPDTFARAASRLTLLSDTPWPRQAKLEMVGIELPLVTAADGGDGETLLLAFEDRRLRLPRGSNGTLRIRAKADDAVVPSVCTVYYQTEDGTSGQANMRRVGREIDGYQSFLLDGPPLLGLSDSMTISVHGLDDRLEDYFVEAVRPPAITDFDVAVRYPDYLRMNAPEDPEADDLTSVYQSGLRIREGSRLTLVAHSSVPLGDIDFAVDQDQSDLADITPSFSQDRREVRFRISDFSTPATLRLVPVDQDGISAQAPYRYFLNVIRDQPPEITTKLPGIGTAVTPIARIPIQINAVDDYGVTRLAVDVSVTADAESVEPQPEDSVATVLTPQPDRDGNVAEAIDLRRLSEQGVLPTPQSGGVINVYAEASDGFNLRQQRHATRGDVFRLQVVTDEQLLALMERRELGLRSRLEQTISETRTLRDAIARLDLAADTQSADQEAREMQILRLRIQQSGLQAAKTTEELNGIVAALGDLLQEMVNNRVDSVDRRERIGNAVRDPLRRIVDSELVTLRQQLRDLEAAVTKAGGDEASGPGSGRPEVVRDAAVQTADEVLLRLTAVLEKMLDLESYNEILDLVRGLIGDQEELLDETKAEQKKRIMNFFD